MATVLYLSGANGARMPRELFDRYLGYASRIKQIAEDLNEYRDQHNVAYDGHCRTEIKKGIDLYNEFARWVGPMNVVQDIQDDITGGRNDIMMHEGINYPLEHENPNANNPYPEIVQIDVDEYMAANGNQNNNNGQNQAGQAGAGQNGNPGANHAQ